MKILVFGGGGQVGSELSELPWPDSATAHAPGRADVDLCDSDAVSRLVASNDWSCVINLAAYTAVDKAETDVVACWRTNALGPAILADATRARNLPLIHVSTDYVFDGSKAEPYTEDDQTNPLGVYGASKLAGELAVRTANPRHVILRTAWVIGRYGSNFVKTMLRLAGDRDEIRVVSDQRGTPTGAGDLASALVSVAERVSAGPDHPVGIFNFANTGETTWAGLAEAVLRESAERGGPSAKVVPITTADYPTAARRPPNSRLSTDRIRAEFGVEPLPWEDAVSEIVGNLTKESG